MRKITQTKGMMDRRQFLQGSLIGAAGLASLRPTLLSAAERRPRAKAVIQIWMWGGPSHLDTFDPKPLASSDYCGPYRNPIATTVAGMQIGQLLPKLAKQANRFSIIRSVTHGVNAHETASYIVQTGRAPDRLVYPSIGAVVSRFKGLDGGYQGPVPPYVVLTEPQGRFSEAGFLGGRYKPFATGGDPNKTPFVVEGIVAEGISDERQTSRRTLLHSLDGLGKALPTDPGFQQLDRLENEAYELMFGQTRKRFDLTQEPDSLRDQYGRNTFGQSCLMARRLVEMGVPFVTINYKGWDTHKKHFEIMNRKLPEMDQGMATLLEDLSSRGLLDSTVVWWTGEFGRSPRVQWDPPWNGGRSHYGECFSAVLAGGGFRGGQVVGVTDPRGEGVLDRPVEPRTILASIYHLLGIDPDGPLPNSIGLNTSILAPGAGLLKELL